MKYSTSPPNSRCHSPFSVDSGSLPMPATYSRGNCMGAATKCYKYLRKLLKFNQMDFEFAMWQMIFLFISPQKIYRNFQSRKQTKSQFARDDPAFFVLLTCWLFVSSIVISIVLGLTFVDFLKHTLYMIFVDYIAAGLIVASVLWFITNHYLRIDKTQDVEWGYAFDIHLNAYFPPLVILHIFQLIIYNGVIRDDLFFSCFIGNTFWFIATCYYIYITFLGYANVEILHRPHMILSVLPVLFLTYMAFICSRINITYFVMSYYKNRI
ncbi:protein unc-50 homolog [Prorops nasuta]|uniref:protein unc-50 homolog n=1 Tax=Prorops nasuta TaxID=863751 RepID=UPI0034CF53B5